MAHIFNNMLPVPALFDTFIKASLDLECDIVI